MTSGAKFISNVNGAFGYNPEGDSTIFSDRLAVGFETMDRLLADNTAVTTGSGNLKLTYFTAPYNDLGVGVRIASGGTAAATVTLIRFGLYTVDFVTGSLTLVASTPNDATLFAAPSTMYSKNWSTPYMFIGGQRYAIGVLFTGTTAPTLAGRQPGGAFSAEFGMSPRIAAVVPGQSDLPATATIVSPTNDTGGVFYAAMA